MQILEGNVVLSEQSTLSTGAYPSPLPTALTGLYTTTFQASQQDMKIVFTNIWGAKTTLDLSATPSSSPLLNLIPETTIAAFGVALTIWFVVSGILKTRKNSVHE